MDSDEERIQAATHAVRVHRPVSSTGQTRCYNCGWPFPCRLYRRATDILATAGWSRAEIIALHTTT